MSTPSTPTTPYTSTHIVQITDTTDRGAYLKIRSAFAKHAGAHGLRDAFVDVVPAHNTLDIGVAASELIHNTERPDRLLLALNCAPAEKDEGTKNNHRSNFYFADLGDGIVAGGTLNGFELSYVKPRVKDLFELVTTNDLGSQFRSLQVLPEHLVRFADRNERSKLIREGKLAAVDAPAVVADLPDVSHVIEIDNFLNVKLLPSTADRVLLAQTREIDFAFGDTSIEYALPGHALPGHALPSHGTAQQRQHALVAPKLFDAGLGRNVLALNSSSRAFGDAAVPMLATIRKRPAETRPAFDAPKVGQPVFLIPRAA